MRKAKFTRLTANLLVLLSLLACNESQHTPQKSYLLVDVNALETDQSETGFPEEINRISVEAINDQEELVASSTASGNSASFNLSVPNDTPLTIIAYAHSNDELLYKGSYALDSLTASEAPTIKISLHSQVVVSAPSNTQTVNDNESITLNIDVQGLNDPRLIYAVNGIEGGSESLGFVSVSGSYTPPSHLLEPLQVQLTATPVAAPSFGETIEVLIEPTSIDLNWFPDEGLKNCIIRREIVLVAALSTLDCSYATTSLDIYSMQGIEKLTALQELNISDQFIESIPALGSLTLLKNLSLNLNLLGDIKGLDSLPSLEKLDLSWNPGFNSLDTSNSLDPLIPLASLSSLSNLNLDCVFNTTQRAVGTLQKILSNTNITFSCAYLHPSTESVNYGQTFDFKGFLLKTVLNEIEGNFLPSSNEISTPNLTSNYSGIIYSVNGIVGGNKLVGTISEAGIYSPPLVNEKTTVTLKAHPIEAPNFKAELNLEVLPVYFGVLQTATLLL